MEFAINDLASKFQLSTESHYRCLAASRLIIRYSTISYFQFTACVPATSLLVLTIPISEYYFL
jgi:hypothetical protein